MHQLLHKKGTFIRPIIAEEVLVVRRKLQELQALLLTDHVTRVARELCWFAGRYTGKGLVVHAAELKHAMHEIQLLACFVYVASDHMPYQHAISFWSHKLADWYSRLLKHERCKSTLSYSVFVEQALQRGAGLAHRITKSRPPQVVELVPGPQGNLTSGISNSSPPSQSLSQSPR